MTPLEPTVNVPADPPAYRILLVEDDPISAEVTSACLRSLGHGVVVANDGHSALMVAQTVSFDQIILDVDLPDMDGPEITRQFRSGLLGARLRNAKIVALTASDGDAIRRECMEAGMDGFLSKPIEIHKARALFGPARQDISQVGESTTYYQSWLDSVQEAHRSLLPRMLESLSELESEMSRHLARNDFDPIRRLGHRIKGVGATFRITRFRSIGRAIETAAATRDAEVVHSLHRHFRFTLDRLKSDLGSFSAQTATNG